MRHSFAQGLELLAQQQKQFGRPPQEHKPIRIAIRKIIQQAGLAGDSREGYFRLLAYSALLGKEAMYNSYKPRKKKK